MKIHDDHMYHGSALIQIAEHPEFTAINSLMVKGHVLHNSYRINDVIGVHFKYASTPTKAWQEYPFTFPEDELDELSQIRNVVEKLFLGLVCVKDREICCLSYEQLKGLIDARKAEKGAPENQYVVLVTAPKNQRLRAYVNVPEVKRLMLGDALIVSRNSFPDLLFS
jgi:hypothetical protein